MQYEVRSIGYHLLERQLVKRLLKVYNLSSKNMCEKLVGWKSLVLWRILRGVRNEEKNEEIKTKCCSLVSRKWLERFSSNVVCRLP